MKVSARTTFLLAIAAVLPAVHAAPTQQDKKDRIFWMDGKQTSCDVIKETFQSIEFLTTSREIKPIDTVRRVEYYDPNDLCRKLLGHVDAQEYDSALAVAESLPNHPSANKKWAVQYGLFYAGYCHYYKRDFDKAIRKFEECRKLAPDTRFLKDSYSLAFRSYLQLQDLKNAEAVLKEFGAKNVGGADVDFLKAELAEMKGDYAAAIQIYARLKSNPQRSDEAKVGEFRCLVLTNKDAETQANLVIRDKGASDRARYAAFNARGAERMRKNQYENALEDFLRVVLGEQGDPPSGTFEFDYSSYGAVKIMADMVQKESDAKKKAFWKDKANEIFREIRHATWRGEAAKEISKIK